MKKSDMVRQYVAQAQYKEALRIAKDFRLGMQAAADDDAALQTTEDDDDVNPAVPAVSDIIKTVMDRRDRRDSDGDPEDIQGAMGIIANQDEDIGTLLDCIEQMQAQNDFNAAPAHTDDDDTAENTDDDDTEDTNSDEDDTAAENDDDDDTEEKPVRCQHVAYDCRCAHGRFLPVGQGSRERPRPHHQHDQQRRQGRARHWLDFLR